MSKAYLIRTQSGGIQHDKVFVGGPPSKEDIEAALRKELDLHGLDPKKPGEERERWARYVEIEVVDRPSETSAPEQTVAKYAPGLRTKQENESRLEAYRKSLEEQGKGQGLLADAQAHGEGRVINPGEPGHEEATREDK